MPKLPLDVSENIARSLYLDDPIKFATLENLSLVDRHFRQAAQRYIFRRLVIDASRQDLDVLLSTLDQNRQLVNYVQEVYVTGMDLPPPSQIRFDGQNPPVRGDSWIPAIFRVLRNSPITSLHLDVEIDGYFIHDSTFLNFLEELKNMPFLANLRQLKIENCFRLDLTLLKNASSLRCLEMYNTSLDPDIPDIPDKYTPDYLPHALERLVVIGLDNVEHHSNWEGHEKLFDLSSLRFLAIDCDSDNDYNLALGPILAVSTNSLTKLVLQIWNYKVLSALDNLQHCKVLANITLWLAESQLQVQMNDGDGESFMGSFHPPTSIRTLQLAFGFGATFESEDLAALTGWCNRHLPELDQNIAKNYDVLWPNLRFIDFWFISDLGKRLNRTKSPLRVRYFEKVENKGVSVNVLGYALESEMLN